MKKLAIKGHKEKDKGIEVIRILEELGGVNVGYSGLGDRYYNYIDELERSIIGTVKLTRPEEYLVFTLEEFLEKYPFRVGDFALVKGYVGGRNICEMKWDENKECVRYGIGVGEWIDIENLKPYHKGGIDPEEPSKNPLLHQLKNYFENTPRDILEKEWKEEYSKYNEIGPTVNEYLEFVDKFRKRYPTSFEECTKVLGMDMKDDVLDTSRENGTRRYGAELWNFYELLICRDAYRRISCGLEWEPDFSKEAYPCIVNWHGEIRCMDITERNTPLAFNTNEVRDEFFRNFADQIDFCKEFL